MGYGKRGKALESLIDYTNRVYRNKGMALVDKVPTPWNVSYNKKTQRVRSAFPERKGMVDYVGVSKGRAIAFDTKNTRTNTSFPLSNVEEHQVRFLMDHQSQGGKSFLLIAFEGLGEHYILNIDQLIEWWEGMKKGERKSIPHQYFMDNCQVVKSGNGVPLDYLQCIT